MTMKSRIKSKIVVAVFASMTLLLSLSLVLTPARSAQKPGLLYATAEAGTKLIAISLEARRARVIGDIDFPFSLALAPCPPGGVRYTITNTFDANKAQLATLNLGTGAATLVGSPLPSGQTLDIMGMTCSRDGTLYAIGQFDTSNPDFNSLYTIDRVTGQATLIGSTDVLDPSDASGASGFLMALAFAPDGELYGANSASTLFKIDTSTGTATKVVDLVHTASAVPLVGVMGLAIDSGGNFYVADFVPGSRIYKVDTSTGLATPILNTGLGFVHNIAFKTPG
jgi:hypothetical protein